MERDSMCTEMDMGVLLGVLGGAAAPQAVGEVENFGAARNS